MQPKLKLKIDVKADIDNAKWFVGNGKFVDWFLPDELQYIIDEKISKTQKDKIISDYTKLTHQDRSKRIESGVKKIEKNWAKIENNFYDFTEELFQKHPWPKGKYIGYASVFLMFPRDVQEKTFYFPYSFEMWNPLRTIGHEMLHFIFFDYIKKQYRISEDDKIKGKNPNYVWQVSETFNTVIENWKPYKDIFDSKEIAKPYPECEKMFEKMSKQWAENKDIKVLLDKWFL